MIKRLSITYGILLLLTAPFIVGTLSTQDSIWFFGGHLLMGINLILLSFLCYQVIHKKNIALLTFVIVLKYGILFILLFYTFGKGPLLGFFIKGYLAALPTLFFWGVWEALIMQKDSDEHTL